MRFYCKFRGQKFVKLLEKLAWNLGTLLFFFEEDGVEGSEAKGGLITEQILFTNFENRNGWNLSSGDEGALELRSFNKVHQQGEFN